MRRFLARFSEPLSSGHARSSADFITDTPVFEFSVHTRRSVMESQTQPANTCRAAVRVQNRKTVVSQSVTKQEAVQMGLLRRDEQPAPTPAQLVAEEHQIIAQEHATVEVANSKREH
jgi:hypothetical protein